MQIFMVERGDFAYKISCWGKGESSEETKKATEERENNRHKHCECWQAKKIYKISN